MAEEGSNHCPPRRTGRGAGAKLEDLSGVPSKWERASRYRLQQGTVQLDVGKILHEEGVCALGQGPGGGGISGFEDFLKLTGQGLEQRDLTLQLALLGAEDWTRDLWRSLPTCLP